jgi:hypothetical protein
MRRNTSDSQLDITCFAGTVGLFATLGINTIDLSALYGRASRDPIFDIPYPFVTRHFPLRIDGPHVPSTDFGGTCSLSVNATAKTFPDLVDHVVNGEPVVPASAYIDLVLLFDTLFSSTLLMVW